MQAGAARVINDAGLPLRPGHMPLLGALDRQPTMIGQLVELGLAHSQTGDDQRLRTVSLSAVGEATMARARLNVFPQVEAVVGTLLQDRLDAIMARPAKLEPRSTRRRSMSSPANRTRRS